ncbi:hypothetical protein CLOLEP_01972 [[Clostridium] leptum DSM 753]|uniref:Uncharacterized protein n=1 Tax=[Clostridium] leptum DSM 753 TaxID=428125 RepID=A7VTS9_9FIRM|nr:hypothetical protein CLOLEP_01972 [[Clostridium] leptum DSM 753]
MIFWKMNQKQSCAVNYSFLYSSVRAFRYFSRLVKSLIFENASYF